MSNIKLFQTRKSVLNGTTKKISIWGWSFRRDNLFPDKPFSCTKELYDLTKLNCIWQ